MKKKSNNQESELENNITLYFEQAAKKRYIENKYPEDDVFEEEKLYLNLLQTLIYKKRNANVSNLLKIAASIFMFFSVTITAYYLVNLKYNKDFPVQLVERLAPSGKVIKVTLMDGTIVFLNAGSKLIYPKVFDTDVRIVTLIGEAYFKVSHDAVKPFIVQSNEIRTHVLGTSFNINAYTENQDIKVTVLTGKVGVYHVNQNDHPSTNFITANQQVVYNKAKGQLYKTEHNVDAKKLVAWANSEMVFNNSLLSAVITDVERHYDIKVVIPKQLKNCRITADFENSDLDKVLKILTKLIDGQIQYKKGVYLLTGSGC